MPGHFLLKINAKNCPSGNGIPRNEADWENGIFSVKPPNKTHAGRPLPESRTAFPAAGDLLLIWVSETEKPRGKGLTAKAVVAERFFRPDRLRLQEIELLPPPRLTNSDIAKDRPIFRADSRETLHSLSSEEWGSWLRKARETAGHKLADATARYGGNQRPSDVELAEWRAERQKTLQLVEIRANQGAFRDELLKRYGKCAVTGWSVEAVLEAAHLIPYASGHPERDSIENGILLRADIHTLMDRYLLAIEPSTLRIVLSPKLLNTGYKKYHGRKAEISPGRFNLECSFKLFEDAQERLTKEPPD